MATSYKSLHPQEVESWQRILVQKTSGLSTVSSSSFGSFDTRCYRMRSMKRSRATNFRTDLTG